MQLFITDNFNIVNKSIVVFDQRIIYQLSKVLRIKQGYVFFIQKNGIRYNVSMTQMQKNQLTGTILGQKVLDIDLKNNISMIIALPNSHKKLEVIVQKLSELGINNIYFWQSDRSIIKKISDNKFNRLKLISLEAVEQSRGNFLPNIKLYTKDLLKKFLEKTSKKDFFVFFDIEKQNIDIDNFGYFNLYGVIGPEGGLTKNDYKIFTDILSDSQIIIKSLGNTILRTETASIIGGWYLKNIF